jgi:hypothetical protein
MSDETGKVSIVKEVVAGLRQSPAYLLVFGLGFILLTFGAILVGKNAWLAGALVVGMLVLGALAIWVVESRMSLVRVDSPEQAVRMTGLKDRETAIHGVLEGLVEGDGESYFVYSSSRVNEFLDHDGKVNPYEFRDDEKVVTTIRDAWGIAMIHGLLHLGGKAAENIEIITAKEFTEKCWDADLILIGSGFANPKTEAALDSFNSPLRFSADRAHIVREPARPGEPELQWPAPGADGGSDYGLIVKLKVIRHGVERVVLVLAGLGPTGTLAACYYLTDNVIPLYEEFQSSPFGLVVRVNKDLGYSSTQREPGSERFLEVAT